MTEDINTDTGVVLEALNDKADRDFNNTNAAGISFDTIDYVVERGGTTLNGTGCGNQVG